MGEGKRAPTCFVSYSWEDKAHSEWVRGLVDDLIRAGVVASVDQRELALGADMAQFMESRVSTSDFVLCVCTPAYAERSDALAGGVGYEKRIIANEVRMGTARPGKIVPLLCRGESTRAIPIYLRGMRYHDFCEASAYAVRFAELVCHLHDEPFHPPPALGPRPDFAAWRRALGAAEVVRTTAATPAAWSSRPPIFFEGFDDPAPSPADQKRRYGELWLIGADGPWYGRVREGLYRLSNTGADGKVHYLHFSMTDSRDTPIDLRTAPVGMRLRVGAEPRGAFTGAGLVYRFDRERRTYACVLVRPDGSLCVARNVGNGLEPERPIPCARLRPGEPAQISLCGRGDELLFFVDDERVLTTSTAGLTGGEVGVVAADVGEFEFDQFAIYPPEG